MTEPTTTPPVRKRRGCLFYGCMTFLVMLLLAGLMAFLTVRWIKNQVNAFTATEPMKLPKVEMSDAEFNQLKQRLDTFHEGMEKGTPVEPLVLTERDINALILKTSDLKQLSDKVYVSLTNDQVRGQISIPLSGLGWFLKGRYLNGQAAFNVSLKNGVLIVTAQEIEVQGKALPETFMKEVRKENLAQDVYKDATNAQAISKLESIELQNDHVVIKARAGPTR